jgi:magnesium-transporting ATPase (P-type)
MLRMFIIYRPFRFFMIIACVFLLAGLIISARFLGFYFTGGGRGHIQSLIFASVLLISGVQIGLIAVLSELISINRKLVEDIQRRLKMKELAVRE